MTGTYDNSHARAHVARYRADPQGAYLIYPWGHDGKSVPTLLLTSTGRVSGKAHTTPLIYRQVDNAYVVVASLGGSPHHPAWYFNLTEAPKCAIQVQSHEMPARARTATGAERDRLWAAMVELYPNYADFQQLTQRQVPVVVLEPAGTGTSRTGRVRPAHADNF